ncbi:MAG: HEAT repeat domain-containing protein [Nitrospiraceae bacterium]
MIRLSAPRLLLTTRAVLEQSLLAPWLTCLLAATAGCYQDAPDSTPQATMEMLITLLGDREATVRLTAAESLGKIGDRTAAPVLLQALHDPDPRVREAAAKSVGALPAGGGEAESELVTLLSDLAIPVRHAAAQALGTRAGTPALTTALTGLLTNPDPTVRQAAAHALFLVEGHGALSALSTSATDSDPVVRQWVIAALGETGDIRAAPVLLERLRHDPVAGVRAEAAYRLQYVGDRSVAAELNAIVQQDSSPDVKRWAGKSPRDSGGISTPVQRVD